MPIEMVYSFVGRILSILTIVSTASVLCCVVLCYAMYHGSSSSIIWREVPPSSLEGSESNVQRFLDTRNSRPGIYTDHVSHELKVDKSLKFEDDGWFRPMLVRLKAFSLVLFIYIVFIQATFYGHNKSPRYHFMGL